MKKTTFIITLTLFASMVTFAQKVQTFGQHWFEDYKQTGKEWQEERKQRNCADSIIQKHITRYDTASDYQEKWFALRSLGEVSCPKTQEFLLQLALSDTSLEFRMLALQYLVWVDARNAIPALLERAKEDLSDEEKLRIGRTIILLEDERAVPIINEVCYRSKDTKICYECLFNVYDHTPRKESIKYYLFRLKNTNNEIVRTEIANRLAMKDCYGKAIPVLKKMAHSGDSNLRVRAAWGLGFIDNKASLSLLQELAQDTANKELERQINTSYERIGYHKNLKMEKKKSRTKQNIQADTSSISQTKVAEAKADNFSFNYAAAVAYAKQWCNSFNPAYFNYSNSGGDCAAFVSQCLIAGGLYLGKGADGNGLGVKNDGVIAGVEYLVRHLRDIQKFRHEESTGATDPFFIVPGDPVFRYPAPENHSLICIDYSSTPNLYACHSGGNFNCSSTRWTWGNTGVTYQNFHIGEKIYPDHCYNCEHDADKGETSMDCGGPCKPCSNAPKRKSIDNNMIGEQNQFLATEQLSTTGEVTFKNSEAPYELIAGEEIIFNEGFSVESGVSFSAKVDPDPSNYVRGFTHVCRNVPNVFTPNGDGVNDVWTVTLVGYTWLEVQVIDAKNHTYLRETRTIDRDGKFTLWDGYKDGKRVSSGPYFWLMRLKDYKGDYQNSNGSLTILY